MTTTEDTSLTGTYRVDPAHARLGFVARHLMLTKVRGAFEAFDGHAHLDFAHPERSSAEVTIEVASVNTRNTRRDEHLRTRAFFDAADHPEMTFRSTAVDALGADRFRLTGDLTVKGHTGQVTVDFTYTGVANDPAGDIRAGFEGRATLDRRDWGLTWGGVLISDAITLELEVVVRSDSRVTTASVST